MHVAEGNVIRTACLMSVLLAAPENLFLPSFLWTTHLLQQAHSLQAVVRGPVKRILTTASQVTLIFRLTSYIAVAHPLS